MDLINKTLKTVDYNRYAVIGGIMAVVMILCLVGCEATTASITGSDEVNATELQMEIVAVNGDLAQQKIVLDAAIQAYNAEIATINSKIDAAQADLSRQQAIKTELFNMIVSTGTAAASGGISAPALITTGIAALGLFAGVGTVADNRRKDAKIKSLKKPDKA